MSPTARKPRPRTIPGEEPEPPSPAELQADENEHYALT
jgi:hypothetical protein